MTAPPPKPSNTTNTPIDSAYHAPVLASEVLHFLAGASRVLDGTLGGGGHSATLLEGGVANVVGVDRDPDALASATHRLAQSVEDGRFAAHLGNFYTLRQVPALADQQFDGILLDLGISSHQID